MKTGIGDFLFGRKTKAINIEIHNHTQDRVDVKEVPGKLIIEISRDIEQNGPIAKALERQYGLRRSLRV